MPLLALAGVLDRVRGISVSSNDWKLIAVLVTAAVALLAFLWRVASGDRSFPEFREGQRERRDARRLRREEAGATRPLPPHNNLPPRPTLIGRTEEVSVVTALLCSEDGERVIIRGPAGIGKSALSVAVGHEAIVASPSRFETVYFTSAKASPITLGSFSDGLSRFLEYSSVAAIELAQEKFEELLRILVGRRCLIIVDNYETVRDQHLAASLFRLPQPCSVLFTSRYDFDFDAPVTIRELRPLDEPDGELMLADELARLGLGALGNYNPSRVDDLLDCVKGSPLGIKWAAGRIRSGLSLETVVRNFQAADADFFESVFGDNWTDLRDRARLTLMAMSTLDATAPRELLAGPVGSDGPELDGAIADLVATSLLEVQRAADDPNQLRYELHPLARSFASRKLDEYPDATQRVRVPTIETTIDFVDSRRLLQLGQDEYERIEREIPNVFRCLDWLLTDPRDKADLEIRCTLLISIADCVNVFLWSRGYWSERIQICEATSRAAENLNRPIAAGRHAAFVGIVKFWQGHLQAAQDWMFDARRLMAAGSNLDVALARRLEALVTHRLGDSGLAIQLMVEVLDFIREARDEDSEKIRVFADWVCAGPAGYRTGQVAVTQEIGIMYADVGEANEAVYWLDKSRALAESIADTEGAAIALSHRGRALLARDPVSARRAFEEGLARARSVRRRSTEGRCLLGLAQLSGDAGDWSGTLDLASAAADIFVRLGMSAEAAEAGEIRRIAAGAQPVPPTRGRKRRA